MTTPTAPRIERAELTPKQVHIYELIAQTPPGEMILIGYGGAAGGGKTRGIVEVGIDLATDFPGNKILIGRKDYSDLRSTTMDQFDLHCPPELVVEKNDTEHWRKIRLPDWPIDDRDGKPVTSLIKFRDMKDWAGLGSEEQGAILIDEAGEVPSKSVLMALSRLRHKLPPIIMNTPRTDEAPWGRASGKWPEGKPLKYVFFAASNPWPGWFERWFVKRELDEDLMAITRAKLHFIPALAKDNPHLPADYEIRLRALYPDDWVKRLLDGRWDAFEGQVYPNFSRSTHEWARALPPPEEWERIIGGLDFGGQSPYAHYTAGIVGILLKSNRLIRVGEFEERGKEVYDRQVAWMLAQQGIWCSQIKGQSKIKWIADRSQMVAIDQWRRMGFNVKPSKGGRNSVAHGISQVARRLDRDAAGVPGSFYHSALTKFPERMETYRWKEVDDDDAAAPATPLERDDDLVDADRYMHEILNPYGGDPAALKNYIPRVG